MKKIFLQSLSSVYIIIGLIFLFNSLNTITGLIIIENTDQINSSFTSLFFIFSGVFFFKLAKRKKRGQAAMEFLMTYGWAILAMIIAIGVLSFFFIGTNNTPSTAPFLLSPPLTAIASNYDESQKIASVEFRNDAGKTITITNVEIGTCVDTSQQNVQPGETTTIQIPACNIKGRQDVKINYKTSTSQLIQSSTGGVNTGDPNSEPDPICGNGVVQGGEQCDDGNLIDGDGCSSICQITTECDDGVDNDGDKSIDLDDPGCENKPEINDESRK